MIGDTRFGLAEHQSLGALLLKFFEHFHDVSCAFASRVRYDLDVCIFRRVWLAKDGFQEC